MKSKANEPTHWQVLAIKISYSDEDKPCTYWTNIMKILKSIIFKKSVDVENVNILYCNCSWDINQHTRCI